MLVASQLRVGAVIRHEGQEYKVVATEYRPGQGRMSGAMHTRLRNLTTGTVWEHAFRSELKLDEVPVEKRAIEEMKHAEKIIARILFLEGLPVVSNLKKINVGAAVDIQLKNDLAAEVEAIKSYNDGIRLCLELGDNGTRELIDANLHDEEEHLDWLEAQLDQIAQMGLQNYLLGQAE